MSHPGGPMPELGPLLGRLASPAPRGPAVLPLDDLRLELVGALYVRAGQARQELAQGRGAAAAGHLAREVWLALWHKASEQAAARLVSVLDRRLEAAAAESRMPPRRLATLRPTDDDRRSLRARVDAAGIPLENVSPPEAATTWEEGLFRVAMAMDESWARLEAVVSGELAAWQGVVEQVRAWRRPRQPLWALTAVALVAALVLGLSLGGYLPAPGPLALIQRLFWSLPWP